MERVWSPLLATSTYPRESARALAANMAAVEASAARRGCLISLHYPK
jgi:hypothetical protein